MISRRDLLIATAVLPLLPQRVQIGKLPPAWHFFSLADNEHLFPVYTSTGFLTSRCTAIIVNDNCPPPEGGTFGGPGLHIDGDSRWYVLEFDQFHETVESAREKITSALRELSA